MHFGTRKKRTCCVADAVQHARHSTSRLARQASYDERDKLVTTSATGSVCNLLCNVCKVMIAVIRLLKPITAIITFNVSYSIIGWSICLFNLFHLTLTNRNCVCLCASKNKNTRKTLKNNPFALHYFMCAVKLNSFVR